MPLEAELLRHREGSAAGIACGALPLRARNTEPQGVGHCVLKAGEMGQSPPGPHDCWFGELQGSAHRGHGRCQRLG